MPTLSSRSTALIILAAATLWIISGIIFPSDNDDHVTAKDTIQNKIMAQVGIHAPEPSDYQRKLLLRGKSKSFRNVPLRAGTAGTIEAILAERGAVLEKNQSIARFKDDARSSRKDKALAFLAQRQAEYDAAKNLEKKGFRSNLKLREAKAQLEEAKDDLAQIELDIRHTHVQAPFDGVLTEREIEIGDYLTIGDLMGRIVDLDPLLIGADVTQNDIGNLSNGQNAVISFTDGSSAEGRITFIDSQSHTKTRTFPIEITIANPELAWRAGLSAEIAISLPATQAHRIASSALTLNDTGVLGIKAVDDSDHVVFYPVEILGQDDQGLWISGLPPDVRVIILGQEYVLDRQKVKPRIIPNGDLMSYDEVPS